AFLRREYSVLVPFMVVVTGLLTLAIGWRTGAAYLGGALCSILAGFFGMSAATHANVRTAEAARASGQAAALRVAFSGGAVMGLAVASLGLLGIGLVLHTWLGLARDDAGWRAFSQIISGFAMGASSIALFARVGGGIYTKAADVGADLVGKLEAGIPEDDPRNPATIADNVGDNVGDAAGMGSDIYESYIVTMLASLLIAGLIELNGTLLFYPMLVGASGLLASIIGIATISPRKMTDVNKPLANAFYVSAAIAIALNFVFTYLFLGHTQIAYALFGSTVIGVILVPVIQRITDYFTSYRFKPVQEIAESAKWGYASLTLMGIIQGMRSTGPFMIAITVALATSYILASSAAPDPTQSTLYGIFGTSLTAMAMLSLAGIVLSIDAFGPISDNAGGIVEMT